VLRDVTCFMSAIPLPSPTFPLFSAVKESDILPNVIKQIKGIFAIQSMGSELSASNVRFTFSLHVTRDFGGRHVQTPHFRPPTVPLNHHKYTLISSLLILLLTFGN
jgi:hypothetical protein